jgi:hypothetical protein
MKISSFLLAIGSLFTLTLTAEQTPNKHKISRIITKLAQEFAHKKHPQLRTKKDVEALVENMIKRFPPTMRQPFRSHESRKMHSFFFKVFLLNGLQAIFDTFLQTLLFQRKGWEV